MSSNGISHCTVRTDLEGLTVLLHWMSFVHFPGESPTFPPASLADPIDRQVAFSPSASCDPRGAIGGKVSPQGEWLGGIFDRGSFLEVYPNWAKSVIVGRARLGGVPVGVIATEVRPMTVRIVPDPAAAEGGERTQVQAGQVRICSDFIVPPLKLPCFVPKGPSFFSSFLSIFCLKL